MAELGNYEPEVNYVYKFNLKLTKEQFDKIKALENKYNHKGLKVWLVKELEERYEKAFKM